jgi:hypothetical protein
VANAMGSVKRLTPQLLKARMVAWSTTIDVSRLHRVRRFHRQQKSIFPGFPSLATAVASWVAQFSEFFLTGSQKGARMIA